MTDKDALKILKSLSDETRFKIVKFLLKGEKCVCKIIPYTKRTQSTVSIHLSKLERVGILKSRKEGRKVFYSISDNRICDIFKSIGYSEGNILKPECCMNKQKRK